MRRVVGRISRRVSYEGGNVDANKGEVVKISPPSPYTCDRISSRLSGEVHG